MNSLPKYECGSSKSIIDVRCCHCGAIAPWNKASEWGWKADEKGKAFVSYYCAKCLDNLEFGQKDLT